MWETTEAPRLEACRELGFRREVRALPADESPPARRGLPHLQAMVEAGASQPKEDGVSDCTSPPQSYES